MISFKIHVNTLQVLELWIISRYSIEYELRFVNAKYDIYNENLNSVVDKIKIVKNKVNILTVSISLKWYLFE